MSAPAYPKATYTLGEREREREGEEKRGCTVWRRESTPFKAVALTLPPDTRAKP